MSATSSSGRGSRGGTIATLLLAGNLPEAEDDPESAFRAAAAMVVSPARR